MEVKVDSYTRHAERAGAFQELLNYIDTLPDIDKKSLKAVLQNLINLNNSRHKREIEQRQKRAKAEAEARKAVASMPAMEDDNE